VIANHYSRFVCDLLVLLIVWAQVVRVVHVALFLLNVEASDPDSADTAPPIPKPEEVVAPTCHGLALFENTNDWVQNHDKYWRKENVPHRPQKLGHKYNQTKRVALCAMPMLDVLAGKSRKMFIQLRVWV